MSSIEIRQGSFNTMQTIRFKRFTKPQRLHALGRELLGRFFGQFESELARQGATAPGAELPDEAYVRAWAGLLLRPEGLPESLNEALYALDEMATPEGRERLMSSASAAGLDLALGAGATDMEVALQVWLAAPGLLARKHNEQRMLRLAVFEYWGAHAAGAPGLAAPLPDPARLDALARDLDDWFARHQRGAGSVRLELYPLAGEHWFLVRHGDTFTRAPAVREQRTEILHFRPERDDVIVYCPERDELRLNARTRGERDQYRRAFGRFLRGNEDYFSERRTYTLEPLRAAGADALDARDVEGIHKIVLRELEVAWDNGANEVIIRKADDLFLPAPQAEAAELAPPNTRLTRAGFDFHFEGCAKPRPVQVLPPNRLKLGRHCDVLLVERWLAQRGFRVRRKGSPVTEIGGDPVE
jgi:hypothetical protein